MELVPFLRVLGIQNLVRGTEYLPEHIKILFRLCGKH